MALLESNFENLLSFVEESRFCPPSQLSSLHSQKRLVQWAVYVTAEFYACMSYLF